MSSLNTMQRALDAAKERIAELEELLEAAADDPIGTATVVRTFTERGLMKSAAVIANGALGYVKVMSPEIRLRPGSIVKIRGGLIVEAADDLPTLGSIELINEVNGEYVEVLSGGNPRQVYRGDVKVEKGDRVVLDASGSVILKNLGKEQKAFVVTETTGVTWDDIGGQEDAKKALREAIELPFKHAELFKSYGKPPVKGVLLHGPPGCGKTMLAKAAATSLAQTHGSKHSSGFIYVKGPEILNKWVGQSEETIRSLFTRARDHKKKHGYPAIVFIDEADAILGKRGDREHSNSLSSTIVPMFLAEMDGFDDASAVVLLATNRPDTLDPAVVRDGRIDRKVFVGRPTVEMAEGIFGIHLKNKAVATGNERGALAKKSSELLYDSARVLYRIQTRDRGEIALTLGHVVNGAMIAAVCEQAASVAIDRDIEAGSKKATGMTLMDFETAVSRVYQQNLALNHDDAIEEFVHPFREAVTDVSRVRL